MQEVGTGVRHPGVKRVSRPRGDAPPILEEVVKLILQTLQRENNTGRDVPCSPSESTEGIAVVRVLQGMQPYVAQATEMLYKALNGM